MGERFFVTGALGCIGAWVVRNLIQEGVPVTVFDLASDPHRMRLIMTEEELSRVQFISGDITDLNLVQRAVAEFETTHIIHLAALQVPFCKANPSLGAAVNVVGTVNLFEAAKKVGLKRLVYASSIAVYGKSEEYEPETDLHTALLNPATLYGVYKRANEGTARVYWLDDQISSVGLRPYTVYGPGRDQGMTSAPTKAMLAATQGQSFHIPFGGRVVYQYADDTAKAFIQAARAPFEGAEVFNLAGSVATMPQIISAIEAAAPAAAGKITYDDKPLPFPDELSDAPYVQALGALHYRPLADAVTETVSIFKAALADGRLAAT